MRALLVKMSSLGDVVHALPAVTDAAEAVAGLELSWVVEDAFAPIVHRHPAVTRVLPIALRRWRRRPLASARPALRFARSLAAERYDLVLDAQGLIKSAAVRSLARAPVRAGFDRGSAREGVSARGLTLAVPVARDGHAVDRLRELFASAFGYAVPAGEPRFGLPAAPASGRRELVFLHGTTWESKLWPVASWRELLARARAAGYHVRLPWGSEQERVRAGAIALAGGEVMDAQSLDQVVDLLAGAAGVVGVDSGLAHLAAALGRPAVVLYGPTNAARTGSRGPRAVNLSAAFACAPCLSRQCLYRGPPVNDSDGRDVRPPCFASVDPDRVWGALVSAMEAERRG